MNNKLKIAAGSILLGSALASSAGAAQLTSHTLVGSAGQVRSQLTRGQNVTPMVGNQFLAHHEGTAGEGKCGEGKCGEGKKAGEAECGEKKAAGEANCGEGQQAHPQASGTHGENHGGGH